MSHYDQAERILRGLRDNPIGADDDTRDLLVDVRAALMALTHAVLASAPATGPATAATTGKGINMTEPILTVFHTDDAIFIRTRGGAEALLTPDDAAAIAIGLIQALKALDVHQQLLRDVEDAFNDDKGGGPEVP